jgi:hypothetical protein
MMRKVILVVALIVAFVGPILTADPGTFAGADNPYLGPYYEQRLDNMGS